MSEKFSVLMSVYYRERPEYLIRSLNSVFQQTLPPSEVVIVEDGPLTKQLYEVLDSYAKQYPNLKRIPLSENHGLGYALNVGLLSCTNELVARMDTDDISLPNRFEKQILFMTEHPNIDICGTWLTEFINTPDNKCGMRKVPTSDKEIKRYICQRPPFSHPTVMFKKSKVILAGNYQHFEKLEDWWLWVRMVSIGATMANLSESLLLFRTNTNTYKRRGGFEFAMNIVRLQKQMLALHISNPADFLKCIFIRFSVALIPNWLRSKLYTKIFRSK